MTAFVHVIDDDADVRDALTATLSVRGLAVQAYPSAQPFLDRLEQAIPGCVVTDVQMPGISGLDLLRALEDRLLAFPVIVLTGQADVPMAVEALKGGASDFLEKPVDGDALCAAVQAALARSADGAQQAAERAEVQRRVDALSPRERDVLGGLVAGQANKEIARNLGISPRTVEAYRASLMIKMQAESLSELVRMSLLTPAKI